MTQTLHFIGKQHGLTGVPGVPARDLSAEEVERYGGEAHLLSLAGGRLYAKMERPQREDKALRHAVEDKEENADGR